MGLLPGFVMVAAGALVCAAFPLVLSLRPAEQVAAPGNTAQTRLDSSGTAMIASALAYPATAWLILSHGQGDAHSGCTGHGGHSPAGMFTGLVPLAAVLALATVLLSLAVIAALRNRFLAASESGGMAAMLASMLIGHG